MFYYYLSTAFSYLVSRFLESGLGYPSRMQGNARRRHVADFGERALRLSSLCKAAHAARSGLIDFGLRDRRADGRVDDAHVARRRRGRAWGPLLLRGLLLFIVLPVAKKNLDVQNLRDRRVLAGYRLKNVVRQLTISFATASVIIVEQHRRALHQARLAEFVNPYNPCVSGLAGRASRGRFPAAGRYRPRTRIRLPSSEISRAVARQAEFSEFAGRLLFPDRHRDMRRYFRRVAKIDRLTVSSPMLSKLTGWLGVPPARGALRDYAIGDTLWRATLDGLPFLAHLGCAGPRAPARNEQPFHRAKGVLHRARARTDRRDDRRDRGRGRACLC